VFAAIYDPFVAVGERAGMRRRRKLLLQGARGRTVEIGSGTGLNLPHAPDLALKEIMRVLRSTGQLLFHRARQVRLASPCPLAGSSGRAVAASGRRLQVQPGDGGSHDGLWI
jgi:hypothetical protein